MTSAGLIPTDTMNLIASIRANGNFGSFATNYYTASGIRLLPNTRPYLSRNISILPAAGSGASIPVSSPLTIRLYFSATEFNALQAADTSIHSIADLSVLVVNNNNCLSSLTGAFAILAPTATGRFGTYNDGYFIEFNSSTPGNFFIAGSASASLPPFAILSFNAVAAGQVVKTDWSTNNLLGVTDFIVERGVDSSSFQPLATVAMADSTGHFSYALQDAHPIGHTSWYRVRAEKIDGTTVYSPAVEVGSNLVLLVLPNPANHFVVVLYPAIILNKGTRTSPSTLQLYTSGGVLLKTQIVPAGSVETTLDISGLANGVYILVLNNNSKIGTASIIKF
jgi:hypothetical protein